MSKSNDSLSWSRIYVHTLDSVYVARRVICVYSSPTTYTCIHLHTRMHNDDVDMELVGNTLHLTVYTSHNKVLEIEWFFILLSIASQPSSQPGHQLSVSASTVSTTTAAVEAAAAAASSSEGSRPFGDSLNFNLFVRGAEKTVPTFMRSKWRQNADPATLLVAIVWRPDPYK